MELLDFSSTVMGARNSASESLLGGGLSVDIAPGIVDASTALSNWAEEYMQQHMQQDIQPAVQNIQVAMNDNRVLDSQHQETTPTGPSQVPQLGNSKDVQIT